MVSWRGGDQRGGEDIPEDLKGRQFAVVAVNYRLAPEVQVADCLDDSASAVAWVFKHISEYGGDPDHIFVSGHSAGGYLTAMVGLDKRLLAKWGVDANRIAGLIPLSGQMITHFTARKEFGVGKDQPWIDELAPLYHVRADAPPLLLITGDRELEMPGRYEENAYFARMMKVAGHTQTRLLELQGYGHGIHRPAFPLVAREVSRILKALDEVNPASTSLDSGRP